MKNNGVIFLKDWKILVSSLSHENQLAFWEMFTNYEYGVEQICENQFVFPIWNFVKSQLDNMKDKYNEKVVSRNQQNGSKGGRPKKETQITHSGNENPKNPMGFNETQKSHNNNNNVNNNVNVNDNVNDILLEKESKQLFENLEFESFDEPIKSSGSEKEKSCAKKEKAEPPEKSNFLNFAKEVYENDLQKEFEPFSFAVAAKYDSWKDAGWKDGHKKPIINWKSKLKNTIPHLKPVYGKSNNQGTNNGHSANFGNTNGGSEVSGKTSFNQILARKLAEQNTQNSESGNRTIHVEVVE